MRKRLGNSRNFYPHFDLLLQVKDLKRQLKGEQKRADQLQTKLQDFIQEIKVKQSKQLDCLSLEDNCALSTYKNAIVLSKGRGGSVGGCQFMTDTINFNVITP